MLINLESDHRVMFPHFTLKLDQNNTYFISQECSRSLVLHCAFLLRTIFASLARAHERVQVQNVKRPSHGKLKVARNSFQHLYFDDERHLEFLLTSHIDFLFIFGQCGDNCE